MKNKDFDTLSLDHRLTVRIGRDHFDALERIAHKEGFSSSIIVRHLIYRFIADKQRFGAIRG